MLYNCTRKGGVIDIFAIFGSWIKLSRRDLVQHAIYGHLQALPQAQHKACKRRI